MLGRMSSITVTLEHLKPGTRITGLAGAEPVDVVSGACFGDQPVDVVNPQAGQVDHSIAYRTDEPSLVFAGHGQAFAYDADGAEMKSLSPLAGAA
jgi:hypothetical protein